MTDDAGDDPWRERRVPRASVGGRLRGCPLQGREARNERVLATPTGEMVRREAPPRGWPGSWLFGCSMDMAAETLRWVSACSHRRRRALSSSRGSGARDGCSVTYSRERLPQPGDRAERCRDTANGRGEPRPLAGVDALPVIHRAGFAHLRGTRHKWRVISLYEKFCVDAHSYSCWGKGD